MSDFDGTRDYFPSVSASVRAPQHKPRAARPGSWTLVDFVRAICEARHDKDCYCESCDNERILRENYYWFGKTGQPTTMQR